MSIALSGFQGRCRDAIRGGKSVLLVAPTGTGKTIAAVEPFTVAYGNGGLCGTRLVYTLPMRALATGVHDDLRGRLAHHGRDCSVAIHHGLQPDSARFCEPAVITTIDQYLTAFAGAPLSFTAKNGHAVAGALLTSYSVFDEVHLLDAKAGLPLLFAMLRQRQDWGLRSCVMTATLPDKVIDHFREHLGLEVIRAEREDIASRDDRRKVTVEYAAGVEPTPEARIPAVIDAFHKHKRVIVFCNTAPRAIEMYQALRTEVGAENVLLAHSRFAPQHRWKRDQDVRERFGKTDVGGILVTTQVAEAGLHISAPAVFSELAPADSLIQRAGRCARFFREATPENPLCGTFTVWPIYPPGKALSEKERRSKCLPYELSVVEKTLEALQADVDDRVLDWEREKAFVNASLSEAYQAFVSWREKPSEKDNRAIPLTPVTALGAFERAFHTSNPNEVESLLRDSVTVEVAVVPDFQKALDAYNQPSTDGRRAYHEPVSLHLSTFARLFRNKEKPKQIVEVTIERKTRHREGEFREPMRIARVMRLRPGGSYFVLASEAGYSQEFGLTGDPALGNETTPLVHAKSRLNGPDYQPGERQSFAQHARGAHREARRILAHYRPFVEAWAKNLPCGKDTSPEDVADALCGAMEAAALLHDIGKLNDRWQQAVGRDGGEPIARTEDGKRKAPHHAQYVHPFLSRLLRDVIGPYRMLDHIALAAARHHVLSLDGDIEKGEFLWTPGGREAVKTVVSEVFNGEIAAACEPHLSCLEDDCLAGEAPGPSDFFYPLYCLANRLVIFADECDAGSGPQELTRKEDVER